jgi:hypothetical protein
LHCNLSFFMSWSLSVHQLLSVLYSPIQAFLFSASHSGRQIWFYSAISFYPSSPQRGFNRRPLKNCMFLEFGRLNTLFITSNFVNNKSLMYNTVIHAASRKGFKQHKTKPSQAKRRRTAPIYRSHSFAPLPPKLSQDYDAVLPSRFRLLRFHPRRHYRRVLVQLMDPFP